MSYEREAISESAALNPAATPIPMREERVFEPYKVRPAPQRREPSPIGNQTVPNGQADTISETTAPTTEETVRLSPQMAALARREQKFRLEQAALTKAKAQLETEKTELSQLRAMKEKLAAKDYSALEGIVDYNEFANYTVNKANGSDPVREEITKLNEKISGLEKQTEEHISKQFDAAVEERRHATRDLVDKTETYPSIKKAKAHEAVVQHILDTWEHDNKELSVQEAAKEVEEILQERAKLWASLLEEKKEEQAAQTEAEKKTLPPMKPALKTLTNQITAGDVSRPRPLHGLSDSERWAEARRRAEAKLQTQRR